MPPGGLKALQSLLSLKIRTGVRISIVCPYPWKINQQIIGSLELLWRQVGKVPKHTYTTRFYNFQINKETPRRRLDVTGDRKIVDKVAQFTPS